MAEGGDIDPRNVQIDQEIPSDQVKIDAEPNIPSDQVVLDSAHKPGLWDTIKTVTPLLAPKFSTPETEEGMSATAEGAAKGVLGPAAPFLEHHLLGVPYENMEQRAKDYPGLSKTAEATTFAGSLFLPGPSIAKGAAALATKAAKVAELGKIGSAMLKGAIETASFTGSDEITKALFNQPGSNPENPWAAAALHVGAAGIMGGLTGGVFSAGNALLGKGIDSLANQNIKKLTEEYLIKAAETGDPLKLKSKIGHTATTGIATPIAMKIGEVVGDRRVGFLAYQHIHNWLEPIVEKVINKPITKANSYLVDAFINGALKNEISGLPNALHYATQIGKGVQKSSQAIEALFRGASGQIAEPASEKAKDSLNEFIENGQVDQQTQNSMEPNSTPHYAKGGQVGESTDTHGFANIFPEQNILMNAAKGRIAGYLNSIRPLPHSSKLPFDEKLSDKPKEKSYHKAIELAVNPLQILNHIQKGDLTPEHMKHFTQMWPDVHRYLSDGLTKRILKAQLDGEKPSYGKRQALSLFLGAPLDSSFTPQSIQAAQAVFIQKQASQQSQTPQPKTKKQGLTKSANSYATDDQAREMRQQSLKV